MPPSDRSPGVDEPPRIAPRSADEARRMAEALSDPLRADIFDVLAGWLKTATVQQIAEFLGESPDDVSRELAVLEASKIVEPLADEPARPGDSPPYRTTHDGDFSDEEWAEFPPALRRRIFARLLDKMNVRIRSALGKGGFDPADVHVTWMPMDLDGLGYNDMSRLLGETLGRAQDIQVEAVERRVAGTADDVEVRSSLMMVHFHDAAAALAEAEDPRPLLAQIFALADDIADEVALDEPDWQRLAESATALARLARRRSQASIVR
jgi:DNA-binding transcriptional ArsR family regulator